jgi:Tfp pilus assembly protein PilO
MRLRERWAGVLRWYAGHRPWERYTIAGLAAAVGLYVLYAGVVEPVLHYRQALAQEVEDGQEELERGARFVAAADALRAERDDVKRRLEREQARLLPGDSGTLAAAALQERVNAIAAAKGITVQSTQVMREEVVEPFRKVAVRLTLSGELRPFVELLKELEYAPQQQLAIPFLEVSRRGAVPGAKGPRTLSATMEVASFVLASAKAAAEPEGAPAGDGEAPAVDGEAPAGAGAAEPAASEAPPRPPKGPEVVPAPAQPPAGAAPPAAASAPPAAAVAGPPAALVGPPPAGIGPSPPREDGTD